MLDKDFDLDFQDGEPMAWIGKQLGIAEHRSIADHHRGKVESTF
jgi:hypothetical protein